MHTGLHTSKRARRIAGAGVLAAALTLAATGGVGAQGEMARVQTLEARTAYLGNQIAELSDMLGTMVPQAGVAPSRAIPDREPVLVAQSSQDIASVNVRLGQLEEQVRVMTGQIEGLQFQMTQLQTLIERMQEDYEFRFQQLEGSASGKTEAAPQSGGAMPSGEAPQGQDMSAPDGAGQQAPDGTAPQSPDGQGSINLSAPDDVQNQQSQQRSTGTPMDQDMGVSTEQDMGSGTDQGSGTGLGAPEQPLGTLSADDLTMPGEPLDFNYETGEIVTKEDADAQYRAGYEAAIHGDFEFAEEQFRQFIGLFPEHPRAPDATNWLGEALILQGAYEDAADVLLSGFQSYPDSERAPDILLKLGVALNGAGEDETACRTFDEVERRYPDMSVAVRNRLDAARAEAMC